MSDYIRTIRNLVGQRRIFVPGVRAIIVDEDGSILLQRRMDMPVWGLPSGSVELGESVLDALKREVMEETSLKILDAEPMALYSGPHQQFVYPNGDKIQCFAVAFIVRRWEGQPQPDGVEGSEVRFFSPSALPTELAPVHKQTLKDYGQYKGTFLVA